jgi:hypothetical protein
MNKFDDAIRLGILPNPNQPRRELQRNRFGVMIFDHKTAGTCQVLNGSQFEQNRKYNVGRNTFGSNLGRFLR